MSWAQVLESDRKRGCFFITRGNADIFLEQLHWFNELIKQEWVNKGNRFEDFQSHGPRIILILDNASNHKRQDIWSRLSQELSNFRTDFLPVYSPDYNIIELVWHSCKARWGDTLPSRLYVKNTLLTAYFNQ